MSNRTLKFQMIKFMKFLKTNDKIIKSYSLKNLSFKNHGKYSKKIMNLVTPI